MERRSLSDRATDCTHGSTDWTTIGARILDAALIASAIHAGEFSRLRPAEEVGPAMNRPSSLVQE